MPSKPPPEIEFPEDHSQFTTWARTHGAEVVCALKEYGCFMAKYKTLHGTRSPLFKESKEIFNRFDATNPRKPEFAYKKNHQYESFDIPEATTNEGIKKFITSMPPEGNDNMRKAIKGYTITAAELEKMLRKMVSEHYKLPKESTGYIFQMMKYKKEVILDFSNREDKFLAVLDLNQVDSLEMKYGGDWFKIDVKPSTFLIMAGKQIKDWKEVKIHGEHGNEEKYSVGLFSYCKKQVGSSSGS